MGTSGSPDPTVFMLNAGPAAIWTNMPVAATEFFGNAQRRIIADCALSREVRLRWRQIVAGVAGSVVRVQYATDDSNFVTIGGDVSLVGTGWKDTGWMALPSGAKVDNCTFMVQGQAGNAAIDPSFSSVALWLR